MHERRYRAAVTAQPSTPEAVQRQRVLDPMGRLIPGARARTDSEELLGQLLYWMLLSRRCDERAIALQREGLWSRYPSLIGQEAAVVGSMIPLSVDSDWIVPQYRERIACIRHGYPMDRVFANYTGRFLDARIPDAVKVLPLQVAIAAQLPHAVGLAWGTRLQGLAGVVLAYVGEGGSSEGDFHEALNLAGVTKAPVVFLLQNNQWAISTPRTAQSATPSFSLRAAGYGFEGIEVDGNDVLAVYDAVAGAVETARRGGGPTLVEAVTYRMGFHNTDDDPTRYMDVATYEKEATQLDPIDRFTAYLRGLGLWDEQREDDVMRRIREEIDDALNRVSMFPAPKPSDVFENISGTLDQRISRQKEASLSRRTV
jgi:pyruvate dehydrogenase E1 component alpha subunit